MRPTARSRPGPASLGLNPGIRSPWSHVFALDPFTTTGGTAISATIQEPGEGIRTIDLAGTTVTAKADGTATGNAFVVAEATLAPGGFEPPLHLHREMA